MTPLSPAELTRLRFALSTQQEEHPGHVLVTHATLDRIFSTIDTLTSKLAEGHALQHLRDA